MGYHLSDITRGIFGNASKVLEETAEFEDAVAQGNKVMALVELSDLIGAVEGYLEKHHPSITLQDLITMKDATKRAFLDGTRVQR